MFSGTFSRAFSGMFSGAFSEGRFLGQGLKVLCWARIRGSSRFEGFSCSTKF
jgi:hypothetical protein